MRLPAGIHSTKYEQELAIVHTPLQWGLMIVFLLALFTVPPLFFDSYLLSIICRICIVIIAIHGLNILTGYCGQISLGQVGFVMIGAYTSAILYTTLGWPFIVAMLCAGLVAAITGLIFGLPSLRVKGFYLAIVTWGAYILIYWIIEHGGDITRGTSGWYIGAPTIWGIKLDTEPKWYLFIISITVLMTYIAKNLVRGKMGRAFIAIRDNDLSAEVMGINVALYKFLAFFICCFYAGIAGTLMAYHTFGLTPELFTLMDNVTYVGMIIVGGMGTILGGILGTIMLEGLNQLALLLGPIVSTAFPALMQVTGFVNSIGPLLGGVVIIVFLLFEPRGLTHRWEKIKASYRLWPFSA